MPTLPVTVLIDTYNHERFIEQAVVSVLEQDFPASDMEILVVDDGSADRTSEIVRKFAPRVRYLRKENGGQASAFNFGIPRAQGEIIAFLDGDDWWARNKLQTVMGAFDRNPHAAAVGHGIIEIDSQESRSRFLSPGTTGYFDLKSDEGAQTFRNFMAFLGTSRVAIRKNVLTKLLPIPEALVIEADEFMSTMAVAYGGAFLLADGLTFYRLHGENLFQFSTGDPVRVQRKLRVLETLVSDLPLPLACAGIAPSAIQIIVEPLRIACSRIKLALDGGMPWETYRVEQAEFHLAYQHITAGYRLYKQLSLLLALILPPRLYYRVRAMYAASNVRHLRSWLGEPRPKAEVRETHLQREALPNGGK
ncbi:MAG TPA: glycosyltransferase family A protein [Candidatus Solibacter sp.]|nr:glycosyltransferase family A protein [Candidatus Solibacter sp.]